MIIVNGQGIDEKSLKLSHWLLLNDYDRDRAKRFYCKAKRL